MLGHKLKLHQQFSECPHQLTPEQEERDTRVSSKDKLQTLCDGIGGTIPVILHYFEVIWDLFSGYLYTNIYKEVKNFAG